MRRFEVSIDEVERRTEQHPCCVGVVCEPTRLGSLELQTHRSAVCRCGSHRIQEAAGLRTVTHRISPNIEWTGWIG